MSAFFRVDDMSEQSGAVRSSIKTSVGYPCCRNRFQKGTRGQQRCTNLKDRMHNGPIRIPRKTRFFRKFRRQRVAWDVGREHREIVTKILVRNVPRNDASLCVFGAGPCNDIDLQILLAAYQKVALVDCDGDALRNGVKKQSCEDHPGIKLCGDVDLFGASKLLDHYKECHDDSLIPEIIRKIQSFCPSDIGKFDCVASTCILSQLLCEASDTFPHNHDQFIEILKSIRLRHFQLMLRCLKPGGHGVLITDFVSSESIPGFVESV